MNDQLPRVCVMMASYNGEKYIREQIESIIAQEDVELSIIVRDDGSTDKTLNILQEYEKRGVLKCIVGSNLGPANNFYKMTQEAPKCDYYAWSDQDDIWDNDKLKIGISFIKEYSRPALYYSASRTVNSQGDVLGIIGADNPSLSFEQALIQSKAQGATFVFNNMLCEATKAYTPSFKQLGILHDAWLHRVCLAIGGIVVHDPIPHMNYRIHQNNVIAKMPTKSIIQRIKLATGINAIHYCSNVANELIIGYEKNMLSENYYLAKRLAEYRSNFKYKFWLLTGNRIKVKSKRDYLKFKWNVLLNRI